jgi:serine/threonine-protein kinase
MGEVWVADHLGLETQVAVKFIHADLTAGDPAIVARFEREAAASAQINSPHVVRTFDRGVMPSGVPYIVMELLQGESLADRLANVTRLGVREVCEITMQVARGLEKAHERGIIHRDIKPENVFLVRGDDGLCAKIVDFGVAKRTTVAGEHKRLTQDGNLIGTPAYLSPEHIAGAAESQKSADMWALSVMTYEMITGRLPFDGATIGLVCVAIMQGKFSPATSLRPDLPGSIDIFFERALHPLEASRFASATELAAALLRCCYPSEADQRALRYLFEESGKFSLPPSVGAKLSFEQALTPAEAPWASPPVVLARARGAVTPETMAKTMPKASVVDALAQPKRSSRTVAAVVAGVVTMTLVAVVGALWPTSLADRARATATPSADPPLERTPLESERSALAAAPSAAASFARASASAALLATEAAPSSTAPSSASAAPLATEAAPRTTRATRSSPRLKDSERRPEEVIGY